MLLSLDFVLLNFFNLISISPATEKRKKKRGGTAGLENNYFVGGGGGWVVTFKRVDKARGLWILGVRSS